MVEPGSGLALAHSSSSTDRFAQVQDLTGSTYRSAQLQDLTPGFLGRLRTGFVNPSPIRTRVRSCVRAVLIERGQVCSLARPDPVLPRDLLPELVTRFRTAEAHELLPHVQRTTGAVTLPPRSRGGADLRAAANRPRPTQLRPPWSTRRCGSAT